ncbi:conserved hypothetical protein [Ricinus communis]|uniref:Uncharacterized protein n=1 Tax=Ricinus communis TaxID=3988 RepID=B9S0W2_RICCO|nr:conserved hypothetical protein [Ricinus communis]
MGKVNVNGHGEVGWCSSEPHGACYARARPCWSSPIIINEGNRNDETDWSGKKGDMGISQQVDPKGKRMMEPTGDSSSDEDEVVVGPHMWQDMGRTAGDINTIGRDHTSNRRESDGLIGFSVSEDQWNNKEVTTICIFKKKKLKQLARQMKSVRIEDIQDGNASEKRMVRT